MRKLASCETMGAAHYVCTDKTGTLTQNKMKVMEIATDEIIQERDFIPHKMHPRYMELLTHAIYHNSSAFTDPEKGPQTEIALLKVANKLTGRNEVEARKKFEEAGYFLRIPFNSSRKRMTTGVQIDGNNLVFTSGASEKVLSSCNNIMLCKTGEQKPMSR